MNKSIIDNISDEKIIKIAKQSISFNDFTQKLGYKFSVGSSTREKIVKKLNELNIDKNFHKNLNPNNTNIEKDNFKNKSVELGKLGEISLMKFCLKNNIRLSQPIIEGYPYDFIAEIKENLYKIQVKTSNNFNGEKTVFSISSTNLSTGGKYKSHSYSTSEVDYFYLYDINKDIGFLVKNENEKLLRSFTINYLKEKYKTAHYYKDFLIENVISELNYN